MDGRTFTQFHLVRALERFLPIPLLRSVLTTGAALSAIKFKKPRPVLLPACLGEPKLICAQGKSSFHVRLNRLLESFPDRLAEPRWKRRCAITGRDRLSLATRNQQPLILALCHFGPYRLLRPLLRAAGFPVFALALVPKHRLQIHRLRSARSPFPEVPISFDPEQLREAVKFLLAGNVLITTIDFSNGKQMDVPAGNDWKFRVATGAFRIAAQHRVPLLPVTIFEENKWRFRIEIGEPVPGEFLAGSDFVRAGDYLLNQMLPAFRKYPEQCDYGMLKRFQPTASAQIPVDSQSRAQHPSQFIIG